MGCIGVATKYPRTLDLHGVREVIQANGPVAWGDSARGVLGKYK